MDRHMDNKHADKLSVGKGSSGCFGDLCGSLGCGKYANDACSSGSSRGRQGCGMCNPADMDRRKSRCKALFHRCWVSAGRATALGVVVPEQSFLLVHSAPASLYAGGFRVWTGREASG